MFSLKGKELVEEVLHTLGPREGSIQDQDVVLALRLLREWDFHLDRNSVGGALYEVRVLLQPSAFYSRRLPYFKRMGAMHETGT